MDAGGIQLLSRTSVLKRNIYLLLVFLLTLVSFLPFPHPLCPYYRPLLFLGKYFTFLSKFETNQ